MTVGCTVPDIILIGRRKSGRTKGKNLVNNKVVLPWVADILSVTRTLLSRLVIIVAPVSARYALRSKKTSRI